MPKHTPILVESLRALGCEVVIRIWGRHSDQETRYDKIVGRLLDIVRIVWTFCQQRFDVTVIKTGHDLGSLARDVLLALAIRPVSRCTVVQFHGSYPNRLIGPGHRLFKLANALLLRLTDGALVLSTEEQRQWQAFYPSGRFYLVKNPFVSPPEPTHSVDLSWLHVPADVPILLYVGRLVEGKGIDELLTALGQIVQRLPCHLLMLGEGPLRGAICKRMAALGLQDHVTLAGYLEDDQLLAAYHCADIFVLPSYAEGFSFALMEAMDAGLPIVTTRIRGMADHLQEETNALFTPPGDAATLAAVLCRLVQDPALRREMAGFNREKVGEFSPEIVGREYLGALTRIARPSVVRAVRAHGTTRNGSI